MRVEVTFYRGFEEWSKEVEKTSRWRILPKSHVPIITLLLPSLSTQLYTQPNRTPNIMDSIVKNRVKGLEDPLQALPPEMFFKLFSSPLFLLRRSLLQVQSVNLGETLSMPTPPFIHSWIYWVKGQGESSQMHSLLHSNNQLSRVSLNLSHFCEDFSPRLGLAKEQV